MRVLTVSVLQLHDLSLPVIVALVALVTALASLAGRARDKATISAYKDNAEVQDRKIANQAVEIAELKAESQSLQTRCKVLEDTANSGDKIDAQTDEIKSLREAIDDHATKAEQWWETLHNDLTARGRRSDDE